MKKHHHIKNPRNIGRKNDNLSDYPKRKNEIVKGFPPDLLVVTWKVLSLRSHSSLSASRSAACSSRNCRVARSCLSAASSCWLRSALSCLDWLFTYNTHTGLGVERLNRRKIWFAEISSIFLNLHRNVSICQNKVSTVYSCSLY